MPSGRRLVSSMPVTRLGTRASCTSPGGTRAATCRGRRRTHPGSSPEPTCVARGQRDSWPAPSGPAPSGPARVGLTLLPELSPAPGARAAASERHAGWRGRRPRCPGITGSRGIAGFPSGHGVTGGSPPSAGGRIRRQRSGRPAWASQDCPGSP